MVETSEHKKLTSGDFEPAQREEHFSSLSRPSLSYWQDAWIRFKKNKRSMISLFIVIGVLFFTILGPVVWTIDPAYQDLGQVSQPPSFGIEAVVLKDGEVDYEPVVVEQWPAEPEEEVPLESIPATESIELVGEATTGAVIIKWKPVPGAFAYSVYRSERKPKNSNQLGIPLADLDAGNKVSYKDNLQLERKTYYYSVVATDGFDESPNYQTIEVDVAMSVPLSKAQDIDPEAKPGDHVTLPSHPLGTDYLGRDMLARLMYGARVSLFIGILAPVFYILAGIVIGSIAGYIGGRTDNVLMRFTDFVVALPFLLFMILFNIGFGTGPGESGIIPMLIALIVLQWPATARLVRGQILQLRSEAFISAAKLLGAKPLYIILRHMIPNTMGVILVTLTFAVPAAIFTEAFLSFIGMGVAPPTPSWGVMCNEGIKSMLNTPHELLFPAMMIAVTVLAFNL